MLWRTATQCGGLQRVVASCNSKSACRARALICVGVCGSGCWTRLRAAMRSMTRHAADGLRYVRPGGALRAPKTSVGHTANRGSMECSGRDAMGIERRTLLKSAVAASALVPLSDFTSTAYAQPAGQKILIKSGYVASLDRNIGELKTGDVLIDGDKIA